ncbi:MAG: hypothetical protein HY039_00170 [Nitrospirae bacterium]|nr:hypothetical protein [Nitrospirota bacterium]
MQIKPKRKVTSGKTIVLLVVGAVAVLGLLFPLLTKKPMWVRVEWFAAGLWLVLGTVMTVLLYNGYHMEDDFKFPEVPRSDREWWRSCDCLESVCEFFSFAPDVEGLAGLLGAAALAAVALAAAGIVILVLMGLFWPVLAFLCLVIYTVLFLALKTVVNAEGEYEGNWLASMIRGYGWALFYTSWLFALALLLHRIQGVETGGLAVFG